MCSPDLCTSKGYRFCYSWKFDSMECFVRSLEFSLRGGGGTWNVSSLYNALCILCIDTIKLLSKSILINACHTLEMLGEKKNESTTQGGCCEGVTIAT
ncbi:hypothetical protein COP1_047308 [Malus domestica]